MMVCKEHKECIVVVEGFRCPVCKLEKTIEELEAILSTYEESVK